MPARRPRGAQFLIKKTAHPTRDAVRHFQALENAMPAGFHMGPGTLICLAQQQIPLSSEVDVVPVGWL